MGRGERSSPSHRGRGTVLGGCCGHVVKGYMQHLPQTVPFPCRRPIKAAVHDIPFHITHITTNDRALSLTTIVTLSGSALDYSEFLPRDAL